MLSGYYILLSIIDPEIPVSNVHFKVPFKVLRPIKSDLGLSILGVGKDMNMHIVTLKIGKENPSQRKI